MLESQLYWWAICDGCGTRFPPFDGSPVAYGHKGDAGVAAFHAGWVEAGDKMFCLECVADSGHRPRVEVLVNDVALELRLRLEHTAECSETFGRLDCICHVDKAAEIVEEFTNDPRNGVTITLLEEDAV